MVLAPPLLIYPLAQARILLTNAPETRIWGVLITVWAVGMAALLKSGWRNTIIAGVGAIYTLVALLLLPLLALSASCMVGPCL
jgi:hypothetical protein